MRRTFQGQSFVQYSTQLSCSLVLVYSSISHVRDPVPMVTANLTQAWASATERRQLTWIDENQSTWNMGHEQNKQWGRTAGQNAILSCLWKEEIKAGRGREKEETGLKACQINALLRQFKSPKRHNPGWHIDDMNIFDYIKSIQVTTLNYGLEQGYFCKLWGKGRSSLCISSLWPQDMWQM